jgi:integrase/recombinase XerC
MSGGMPKPKRDRDPILPAGPDIAAEAARWLAHLKSERRLSPKTLEAYERDLRQCLMFLAEHWGKPVSLKAFAAIGRRTCAPSWPRGALTRSAGAR